MKTIRKSSHHVLSFLLALVLVCGVTATAYAATSASLDLTQTGSIQLTLADSDGNVASGGAVTLYQVAVLTLDDGNMTYVYADAFSGCEVTLEVEDTSLAASLATYVQEQNISGDATVSIGTDGTADFSDLVLGLYLIVQTTESDSYKAISPFVVTVPLETTDGWTYTVDASPKVGTVTPVETETETEQETESEEETESEQETESEEETESEQETESEEETEPEKETEFESESEEETTSALPQTGQLNWPIPVLALSGLLLFMLGWYLNRTGRKRDEYED
ncbi:MAG: hypothetical protein LUE63_01990 [Lachnospiraceae bacterium]|nr:hypothetical protein [Lachnospiraceae bacterium]